MRRIAKKELVRQVVIGARAYGISTVLFRHSVARMLGLSVTDMECLALVFFKGLASPSELSRYTGLTSGATTTMLDRLERAGLIERRPNPDDRRGTLIVIVKEAAERVGPLFEPARKAQEALVSSYSEKELQLLAEFFSRSRAMWEEEREKLQKRLEEQRSAE